jgi:hypothetical protein
MAPGQASPVPFVVPPHAHSPEPLHVSPTPQTCPHEPQALVFPSVVSQPFSLFMSQSSKPTVHVA